MLKNRTILLAVAAFVIVVTVIGFLVFHWPWGNTSTTIQEQRYSDTVDLGITYVPVTSGLSIYHDLGVSSGALVTELAPDSVAYKAGVDVGDIIVSFNGLKVEKETPLLGMMRSCRTDSNISLEVQTGMNTRMVEIIHAPE